MGILGALKDGFKRIIGRIQRSDLLEEKGERQYNRYLQASGAERRDLLKCLLNFDHALTARYDEARVAAAPSPKLAVTIYRWATAWRTEYDFRMKNKPAEDNRQLLANIIRFYEQADQEWKKFPHARRPVEYSSLMLGIADAYLEDHARRLESRSLAKAIEAYDIAIRPPTRIKIRNPAAFDRTEARAIIGLSTAVRIRCENDDTNEGLDRTIDYLNALQIPNSRENDGLEAMRLSQLAKSLDLRSKRLPPSSQSVKDVGHPIEHIKTQDLESLEDAKATGMDENGKLVDEVGRDREVAGHRVCTGCQNSMFDSAGRYLHKHAKGVNSLGKRGVAFWQAPTSICCGAFHEEPGEIESLHENSSIGKCSK